MTSCCSHPRLQRTPARKRGSAPMSRRVVMRTDFDRHWLRRPLLVAVFAVVGVSCAGDKPFNMPEPGPSSLFVRPSDATFRIELVVDESGVRSGSGSVSVDRDGYVSDSGTIIPARVTAVESSAQCSERGRRDPILLTFGARWTGTSAPADPYNPPFLPTRFRLPNGDRSLDAIRGKPINVWGITPAAGPGACFVWVAQFVDAEIVSVPSPPG